MCSDDAPVDHFADLVVHEDADTGETGRKRGIRGAGEVLECIGTLTRQLIEDPHGGREVTR